MRNTLELLEEKELDLVRIRKEIAALRIVAPLLCDDRDELVDTKDAIAEHFDLKGTGTDGFLSSGSCALALSEGEISHGQPFLVPKPTKPGSNFWQWLCEQKQNVLARLRGPARRILLAPAAARSRKAGAGEVIPHSQLASCD